VPRRSALPRPLYVSLLARVEVPAALWRKHRTGALTTEEAAGLVADFSADFHVGDEEEPRFHTIGVSRRIIDRAAELLSRHNLRAYDAVQLATARTARTLEGVSRSPALTARFVTPAASRAFP
jgi:predicted nucleic acid-binding protein